MHAHVRTCMQHACVRERERDPRVAAAQTPAYEGALVAKRLDRRLSRRHRRHAPLRVRQLVDELLAQPRGGARHFAHALPHRLLRELLRELLDGERDAPRALPERIGQLEQRARPAPLAGEAPLTGEAPLAARRERPARWRTGTHKGAARGQRRLLMMRIALRLANGKADDGW